MSSTDLNGNDSWTAPAGGKWKNTTCNKDSIRGQRSAIVRCAVRHHLLGDSATRTWRRGKRALGGRGSTVFILKVTFNLRHAKSTRPTRKKIRKGKMRKNRIRKKKSEKLASIPAALLLRSICQSSRLWNPITAHVFYPFTLAKSRPNFLFNRVVLLLLFTAAVFSLLLTSTLDTTRVFSLFSVVHRFFSYYLYRFALKLSNIISYFIVFK